VITLLLVSPLVAVTATAGDIGPVGPEARELAARRGLVIRAATPTGVSELQRFVNGVPMYYTTTNLDAADSLSVDECWPGGPTGLGLTGAGVTLGIWDAGGVRTTHQEFGGRVTNGDGWASTDWHATHVGGTMIAAGVFPGGSGYPAGQSKGMSPSASLLSHDWDDDDTEMASAAAIGLRVSNHSYGYVTGWDYDDFGAGPGWYWFGDVNISTVEDFYFGFYSFQSGNWDEICHDYPYYLFVTSAGNDRDEGPEPGTGHWYWEDDWWAWSTDVRNLDGNDGYDCVGHQAVAKNGLVVGAVEDVIGGYASPGDVAMTSFSCWGPTDDGRIKPDVVGNGYELLSAYDSSDSTYVVASGTSMSSPNVSGALGLLIQHWRSTHPSEGEMRSAMLKGVAIHTADECGFADGPDYRYGWGLVNAARAATVISDDVAMPLVLSLQAIGNEQTFELYATTNGVSGELRATICWTDPPGTPPPDSIDPTTLMLVNDLDLQIVRISPEITYYPWVLNPADPAAPATTGDNYRDNVEQVVVAAPGAAAYTIRVTPDGPLSGGIQAFALVVTGAAALSTEGPRYALAVSTVGQGEVTLDPPGGVYEQNTVVELTANAETDWAFDHWEGDLEGSTNPDTIVMDDHKTVTAVFVEFSDCNGNGVNDSEDIANGTSADCNGNGVPDECDIDPGDISIFFSLDADPGWTTEGLWGCGPPTGQGGQHGQPDPNSGYSGANVYGYNLDGDYENNLDETHLTSSALDCTGMSAVTLSFWRWLGVEQPTYDHAYVRVSNNGDDWVTVWENTAAVADSAWVYQEYDISAVADDQPTVYLRWTMGATDSSWQYCGWNIDDVEVSGGGGTPGGSADCNENGVPDECDIADGTSDDLNDNGIPDECEDHYTLTLNTVGQGSVDLDPPGGTYVSGLPVQLTATADPGWYFDHWEDGLTGSDNPDTIVMDADQTVTAVFAQHQYTLTVDITGGGTVDLDPPGGTYPSGTPVELTANAEAGWYFDHWEDGLTGSDNPDTIVMDEHKSVTAVFVQYQYTLTVNITGSGTVDLDPPGGTYPSGTPVELTANAEAGWYFDRWEGGLTGSDNPDTIVMDGDQTVTAVFVQYQYTLTVNIIGNGTVDLDPPGGTYPSGTLVELTANAEAGWYFDRWEGDLTGSDNPDTIVMDDDQTVTAVFEQECFGDLDGDGVVGIADLAQLLGHYGVTGGATYEDGDLDGDGDVDIADLAALLGVYGTVC